MIAVWASTVAPLVGLHVWWWLRQRELLRFQLILDLLLAVVVGPALVRGADLNSVHCLSRNRPFTEWQWAEATQYQPTHSDLVLQIHPWLDETRRQLLGHELPLISDRIGGGLPLLANGQSGLWAPVNLPVWALGVERGTTVMALWKLELAALGAFLLLLRGWRLSRHAAAVGGIAWGGGCYLLAWLLVPMGWVIAALPWIWWAVGWALRGRVRPWRVLLIGTALGVLMGCGLNPETAVIVAGSALLAGLVLHPRRWRRIAAVALVGGFLAAMLAWPTLGYIRASEKYARVRAAQPNTSRPPSLVRLAAAQQLVVPMIHGHPGRDDWHGPYPYAAAAAGIGGLGLGLLVIGRVRWRHRGLLCAAWASLAVALVLAYRLPPFDAVLVRLPPIDRMTLPRFVILAGWSLAVWAAVATDGALRGRRRFGPWSVAPAAAVVAVALLGAPWSLAGSDLALVAVTALAAAVTVPLLGRPAWLAPAMALELAVYAVGINPVAAVEDRLPRPPLLEQLVRVQREEGGRVLGLAGLLPANLAARYGLCDLRAYDPLRPRPYVRMLAALGDPDPILGGPLTTAPAALAGAWSVRFLLTPPGLLPVGWQLRWKGPEGALWSNPRWLPQVRVVGHAVEADDRRGWRMLTEAEIDLASSAVVPEGTPEVLANRMELFDVDRRSSSITARIRCSGPCLLVVAQPWSPGWRARVDGDPVPIVRANLAGLGVATPDGDHRVELRYHPWRW